MYKNFFMILIVFIMLAGCLPQKESDIPAFPEVDFAISNLKAKAGETLLFDAFVSVEGEPIENADRVEFEIWHENQEDSEHEHIVIEQSSEGHYTLEKSFETKGVYYIYYHVDTMGLHLMNKYEFIIQ